jgi:hypothetical protein
VEFELTVQSRSGFASGKNLRRSPTVKSIGDGLAPSPRIGKVRDQGKAEQPMPAAQLF